VLIAICYRRGASWLRLNQWWVWGGEQKQKTGRDAASHEQLLVFLDVMHAEGRHSEALEALRGDAGALASIASERELLQAHCLERMGRAQEAAGVYKVNPPLDTQAHRNAHTETHAHAHTETRTRT
jgi:hypothetical protein